MAGLRKAKKYDWKDSNMALFGSDTEKQVKKESAMTEPAWNNAGTELGIRIWRIVKFQVTDWPKEDYGKFFDGDSYIILRTYKEGISETFLYDLHFWIGKHSSQDEYGTAAYKTVELDTFLDDAAVQRREVMGHESELFRSYFPQLTTMTGGAETGFRHVGPREYVPRLLHFNGKGRRVTIREVELCRGNVKSNDVYILDLGEDLYQWNGSGASKDEKFKAMQYLQSLESERCGRAKSEVLEEGGRGCERFYASLRDGGPEEEDSDEEGPEMEKKLLRLSDAGGKLDMTEIKTGGCMASDLKTDDVFLFDSGKEIFVWIGKGASQSEKKNGMTYAHNYLKKADNPAAPVTVVREGQNCTQLEVALTA